MTATMHIGELADRSELSLRTIRHYDEIGLLKPSARSDGGYRLYTERDFERLMLIRRMKPLGFALEEMGELLAAADALEADPADGAARSRMDAFLTEAVERRAKLERQLAAADEFIARLSAR